MKLFQRLLLAIAFVGGLAFTSNVHAAPGGGGGGGGTSSGNTGSVNTSNSAGATNINSYASKDDVYISGKNFTPNTTLFVRVTAPSVPGSLSNIGTVQTLGDGSFALVKVTAVVGQFADSPQDAGNYDIEVDYNTNFSGAKKDHFQIAPPAPAAPVIAAPVITQQAANSVVECNGSGNLADLAAWLNSHGGAVATGVNLTWSNNFSALSDLCGATGAATVTFTVSNAGGSASTTATFTIVDTTAPAAPTSNVVDFLPRTNPTFTVGAGADACDAAPTAQITGVSAYAINGAGKTIVKTIGYTLTGNSITITDAGVGTIITITGIATDACGNVSAPASFTATVLRPANEGVGNGVDGNTPGHANNGGNDAAGTAPGAPGAKTKKG